MQNLQDGTGWTFGELIESAYRTYGRRRAIAMIRLAAKARLIVFQRHNPSLVP